MHKQFETLLEKKQAGLLSPQENKEYEAICVRRNIRLNRWQQIP